MNSESCIFNGSLPAKSQRPQALTKTVSPVKSPHLHKRHCAPGVWRHRHSTSRPANPITRADGPYGASERLERLGGEVQLGFLHVDGQIKRPQQLGHGVDVVVVVMRQKDADELPTVRQERRVNGLRVPGGVDDERLPASRSPHQVDEVLHRPQR